LWIVATLATTSQKLTAKKEEKTLWQWRGSGVSIDRSGG